MRPYGISCQVQASASRHLSKAHRDHSTQVPICQQHLLLHSSLQLARWASGQALPGVPSVVQPWN